MPDTLDPHPSAFVAMANGAGNCRKQNGRVETRPCLEINFIPVPGTNDEQFQKDFPAYKDGLVYSNPGRYVVMPEYPKKAEIVYNLKPRPDDVYVLTFPKCGKQKMCLTKRMKLRVLLDIDIIRHYMDARTRLASN